MVSPFFSESERKQKTDAIQQAFGRLFVSEVLIGLDNSGRKVFTLEEGWPPRELSFRFRV